MNGVINFLKPPAMSSNGAVLFLRGLLGIKRVGHAGTLDPGACGVLAVCVGKATRISSYIADCKKEYVAEVSFGKSTDTGDSYGEIIRTSDMALPEIENVKEALSGFCGKTVQKVPAYSAVKHEGKKLYMLARAGKEIPEKKREIEIFSAQHIMQTARNSHLIKIVCAKGTYIRVFCEDLGEKLGLPAYMSLLVRTKCAGLDISQAYTADELKQQDCAKAINCTEQFLTLFPRVSLDKTNRSKLVNGAQVAAKCDDIDKARLYAQDEFIGLGYVRGGVAKITTLLVD